MYELRQETEEKQNMADALAALSEMQLALVGGGSGQATLE